MPSFNSLAFWFCSFWVCFFGGCMGVKPPPGDSGWVDGNRFLNQRVNDHSIELMSLRSAAKQEAIDQNKHHMYHLTSHCRVIDRCIGLECRIKHLEQRMVIVVPQEMPPLRLMDPRELDPNPNIPPQKLPITPDGN